MEKEVEMPSIFPTIFPVGSNGQQQQSTGGGGASNYGTLQDGQKQQQSLSALFSATVEDGTRAGGSSNNGIGGTSSEFAGGAGWNEDVAGKPWYHQCINRYVSFAAVRFGGNSFVFSPIDY